MTNSYIIKADILLHL